VLDTVFIGLGVLPALLGLVRAARGLRPATPIERDVRPELRRVALPRSVVSAPVAG